VVFHGQEPLPALTAGSRDFLPTGVKLAMKQLTTALEPWEQRLSAAVADTADSTALH
jgi:hypothetical protein